MNRSQAAITLAAAIAGVSIIVAFQQAPARRGDYLAPELRTAVEKLKREAEAQPTSQANIVERGKVLFDWINAYSLTGGPIPVNATQQLSPIYALEAGERDTAAPGQMAALARNIDALIYEFRMKDERPAALPAIRLSNRGPFPVASLQTIEQVITVGQQSFVTGATLLLGRQLMADSGAIQITDPKAEGYVSIRASRPAARFERTAISLMGMHGGFRGAVEMPAFKLVAGTLVQGDTIVLTYGDRTGGSPGLRLQSFANGNAILPVYVDPEAKGRLLTPVWPGYEVIGAAPVALRLIAPSIVRAGETFEVAIRAEDNRWNRAAGRVERIQIFLNGEAYRTVPAVEGVAVMNNVTIPSAGTYRFRAASADGKVTGESNPVWVEQSPSHRVFWGETHAHTGMAEGQGTVDGFYRYGREDARLDFLGLSEHDIWLDDGEWQSMQEAVKRYTEPGRFIAFLGYEWTNQRQGGGHHNVFFRTPDRRRVPVARAWTLSLLYQGLRSLYSTRDVLIIPHAHQAGDWRRNDPDMERLVEIMSMHGTFEWFGNYYLKRGYDVGFVAASDDHRTRPGLSGTMAVGSLTQFGGLVAVMASEKTAPAIFDALRARSTYAVSNSERILLDVTMNGSPARGQRLPQAVSRKIGARISGTAAIDTVDVIKNGDMVFSRRFLSAPLSNRVRAQITFESDSEPYIRDNPRGYRTWKGSLEVSGARVLAVDDSALDNRHVEFARLDTASSQRVAFFVQTRGRADRIELDLDGVTAGTRIEMQLDAALETGTSPPAVRPAAQIPASRVQLSFGEIKDGLLVRPMAIGAFRDQIALQLINPAAPKDQEFDYTDLDNPRPGDYYYIRVIQRDGARAWSSPVWVGGEAAR